MILYRNLRLVGHVQHVQRKAAKLTTQLNLLMSTISGPRSSKSKLLVSVETSVILYAATCGEAYC